MVEGDFHKKMTLPGWTQDQKLETGFSSTPKLIGPYKIECLLERGGMSYLFLGIHPETADLTTIKVLSPRFLSHPEAVQRFLNEAEIIAMTDHPNIVKLYGHGEWEGGLYIAMEYISGYSLRQILLHNPISLKRALEIVIDIAYALCHLHTHGVIHRDLKPENILITDDDQVKVIDFGIAQLLTEKNNHGAKPKQRLIGTPIYMSPEQRENPETVSYPSDIYSLGIIAYELILGKLSHGQLHLSLMPKGMQKILNKALQHQPKDRYQDVVDLITDVTAYLNSSNLQKEKLVGDQLSELLENFRHMQEKFYAHKPEHWKGIEVGMAMHKGMELSGPYCDFLDLDNGDYGVVLAESSAKGAEGMVEMAMLKGMIRSLRQAAWTPVALAENLNKLIFSEQLDDFFTLNYLVIAPQENHVQYVCCGHGGLWIIPAKSQSPITTDSRNIALGLDTNIVFSGTEMPFQRGDHLVLISDKPAGILETRTIADLYLKTLQEHPNSHPQPILDMVLKKIKLATANQAPARSCLFIGIEKV